MISINSCSCLIKKLFYFYKNRLLELNEKFNKILIEENYLLNISIMKEIILPFPKNYSRSFGQLILWGLYFPDFQLIYDDPLIKEIILLSVNNVESKEDSLFNFLEKKIDEITNDNTDDEIIKFLVIFFSISSEFFFIFDLLESSLMEIDANRIIKTAIKRIINFYHLKLITCFQFMFNDIKFFLKIDDEDLKRLIVDCEITLKHFDNPDILKINLNYLLFFDYNFSLFDSKNFLKSIELCKIYSRYEGIVENISLMNERFYREHFTHSIYVSALVLILKNFFDSVDYSENLNCLILCSLLHDWSYPIEKTNYVIENYLNNLNKISFISMNKSEIYKVLTPKNSLIDEPEHEGKFYNFIRKLEDYNEPIKSLFDYIHDNFVFNKKCDHGYISAWNLFYILNILQLNRGRLMTIFNMDKLTIEEFDEKIHNKFQNAIYSILTHNIKPERITPGSFNLNQNHLLKDISILRIADSLQDWSREFELEIATRFESIEYDENNLTVKIDYSKGSDFQFIETEKRKEFSVFVDGSITIIPEYNTEFISFNITKGT